MEMDFFSGKWVCLCPIVLWGFEEQEDQRKAAVVVLVVVVIGKRHSLVQMAFDSKSKVGSIGRHVFLSRAKFMHDLCVLCIEHRRW